VTRLSNGGFTPYSIPHTQQTRRILSSLQVRAHHAASIYRFKIAPRIVVENVALHQANRDFPAMWSIISTFQSWDNGAETVFLGVKDLIS
jgi:hypothetical protein